MEGGREGGKEGEREKREMKLLVSTGGLVVTTESPEGMDPVAT